MPTVQVFEHRSGTSAGGKAISSPSPPLRQQYRYPTNSIDIRSGRLNGLLRAVGGIKRAWGTLGSRAGPVRQVVSAKPTHFKTASVKRDPQGCWWNGRGAVWWRGDLNGGGPSAS